MHDIARADPVLEDILDLHRVMAEVNSDMNSVLSKSVGTAHFHLNSQSEFAEAVKRLQTQLLRDLRASNVEAQTYVQKLVQAVDSTAQIVIGKISTAGRKVEEDFQDLGHVSNSVLILASRSNLVLEYPQVQYRSHRHAEKRWKNLPRSTCREL